MKGHRRFEVLLLGCVIWWGVTDRPLSAADDDRRFFSISINGNVIGYNMIDQAHEDVDGEKRLRVDSETYMKLAVLGKERSTLANSTTWLDPATGRVTRYLSKIKANKTISHIECKPTDSGVQLWKWENESPKGEPQTIESPADRSFIGSNNFAHWEALIRQGAAGFKEGKASFPVFLPEAMTAATFELQKDKLITVSTNGKERTARLWVLKGPGIQIAMDESTGEMLQMKLPGQDALIEPADEKIVKRAQKSQAEEVLARLFTQSNVVFDDFAKVTELVAKVDVAVFGVSNDDSVLETAMQTFEGKKNEENVIRGTIRVKSKAYLGEKAPTFPTAEVDPALTQYTKPSPLIESEHEAIKKQAATLAEGAKDRWDVVKKIGGWVHEEIAYTIADTPSAKLCLETRKGDCGPHSTLTIAMLRSLGIPAKLVGGVVYTPSFGGSFGQHAWVEVHMGDAGWVAVDPTTDEFDQISATHIKFFEGVGGVQSKSIFVESYEPPNRTDGAVTFSAAKPIGWKLKTRYTFRYTQADKVLGDEAFQIEEAQVDGRSCYKLTADLKLQLNLITSLTSKTKLTVRTNGQPVEMKRSLTSLLQTTRIDCAFGENKVHTTVAGLTRLERDMDLPPGAFCFDNNLMAGWALIGSQLPLQSKSPLIVRTYHPSTLQVLNLTFDPKGVEKIKIGGEEVECLKFDVAPVKNTFWFTTDGRFAKAKQGNLVIELLSLNPESEDKDD